MTNGWTRLSGSQIVLELNLCIFIMEIREHLKARKTSMYFYWRLSPIWSNMRFRMTRNCSCKPRPLFLCADIFMLYLIWDRLLDDLNLTTVLSHEGTWHKWIDLRFPTRGACHLQPWKCQECHLASRLQSPKLSYLIWVAWLSHLHYPTSQNMKKCTGFQEMNWQRLSSVAMAQVLLYLIP